MGKYILALDQGTTSSRAILFDEAERMVGVAQQEFSQIYPQEGWVEQNPMEIYSSQYAVMMEVIARTGVNVGEIAAIGITNQRETTILWDKATGQPIYNAIVWQCRRTAKIVEDLVAAGLGDHIKERTGLVPDAYFSGSKIKWILDHVPGARERARRGEILFGTVDSWLIWNLTGGREHISDYSNCSRTMLFDIRRLRWDPELLELFGIPEQMLPRVQRWIFPVKCSRRFAIARRSMDIPLCRTMGSPLGESQGINRPPYLANAVFMRERQKIPMVPAAFCS